MTSGEKEKSESEARLSLEKTFVALTRAAIKAYPSEDDVSKKRLLNALTFLCEQLCGEIVYFDMYDYPGKPDSSRMIAIGEQIAAAGLNPNHWNVELMLGYCTELSTFHLEVARTRKYTPPPGFPMPRGTGKG